MFVVVFARDVHERFCDTRTPNNLYLQRITIPLMLFLSMLFYVTFIEVSLSKAATEAHDTELSGFLLLLLFGGGLLLFYSSSSFLPIMFYLDILNRIVAEITISVPYSDVCELICIAQRCCVPIP